MQEQNWLWVVRVLGIPDGDKEHIGGEYQRQTTGRPVWRFVTSDFEKRRYQELSDVYDKKYDRASDTYGCQYCGKSSGSFNGSGCDNCVPFFEASCGCFMAICAMNMCSLCRKTSCFEHQSSHKCN